MDIKIGYPEFIFEDDTLDDIYEEVFPYLFILLMLWRKRSKGDILPVPIEQ